MLSEFRGHHCQHRSDDFPDIAAILKPHRPRLVVELGTDEGGFAAFLANLVGKWDGRVVTFDIKPKFKPSLLSEFKNLRYVQADILGTGPLTGPPGRPCVPNPEIAALVAEPGVFLYCDNGHKQSEVEIYAPLLQVGSILGVHDYNTEISSGWVEPFVAALGYEPEGHARMEALRNQWYPEPMSRFWVRRRIVEPRLHDSTKIGIAPPVMSFIETSIREETAPDGSVRLFQSFRSVPAPDLLIDDAPEPPPFVSAEERAWFLADGQAADPAPSGDVAVGRRRRRRRPVGT